MPLFLIFAAVLVVAVIVIAALGICIVPQGFEYVIQRLGKFHTNLTPGLSFIIPMVDEVAYKIDMRDTPLQIQPQEAITKDNVGIVVDAITFIRIVDSHKAVYDVSNYSYAVTNIVLTSLRSIIGTMTLNETLGGREKIRTLLREAISNDISGWGITIKSVELQDLRPSPTMMASMEKQAAAEREREAMTLQAEGRKNAAILEAEGKLTAAEKEAQAQVVLANASATAIKEIAEAIGNKELPAMFLLGDRYIKALEQMTNTGKVVVMPADILSAVSGLMGKLPKV